MTTPNQPKQSVRIGCWSAFWGDSVSGAQQLVKHGDIDYLVGDYLAEVTMGILARQKQAAAKAPGSPSAGSSGGRGAGGYVSEFAKWIWRPLMAEIVSRDIRVVTNAGGLDPLALKALLEDICREGDFPGEPPEIAAVYGDDLLALQPAPELLEFRVAGQAEQPPQQKRLLSANAYLGAFPVARALARGARVVVTGRTADSALVLGPLIHAFGWSPSDYDLLAAGSVAGHVVECACQATGGNFTDWRAAAFSPHGGWRNMGFPVVAVRRDGGFVVTKPRGTGGLVSRGTVAEQLLYEIGDPAHYVLPDVTVDFTGVSLHEAGEDAVEVRGVRGRAPTDCYKVSATHVDGYRLAAELLVAGEEAREKALEVAAAVLHRARRLLRGLELEDFAATHVEALGTEQLFGDASRARAAREVLLRIVVHHRNPLALRAFGAEVAPAATAMAPGITGGGGGRPRPQAHLVHASSLVRKPQVPAYVAVGRAEPEELHAVVPADHLPSNVDVAPPTADDYAEGGEEVKEEANAQEKEGLEKEGLVMVPLIQLCWGRSGDKGDVSNIGLIARERRFFPYVKQQVTASVVRRYMKYHVRGVVQRYELPELPALNFVMTQSLGGGGLSSLHIDRQGKTFAQILLTMKIAVPVDLLQKSKL